MQNEIVLNEDQQRAVDLLRSGHNFFLTGKAGTGKTITLAALIRDCQLRQHAYAVTASTGMASLLLAGRTIHSWSGMCLGTETLARIIQKIMFGSQSLAQLRIRDCKTLFIDEISMLATDFFNKLDIVCREIRNNRRPFGGIQIVLCGDFFQLGQCITTPDRLSNDSAAVFKTLTSVIQKHVRHDAFADDGIIRVVLSYWSPTYTETELRERYLFLSRTWIESIHHYIYLQRPYRQKDPLFLELLDRARHGMLTKQDDQLFLSRIGKELNSDINTNTNTNTSTTTTKPFYVPLLHPYTKHVRSENEAKLKLVDGQSYIAPSLLMYKRRYARTVVFNENRATHHRAYQKTVEFANTLPVTSLLKLKIGAPIIIVHNVKLPQQNVNIANGQRGIVTNIILAPTTSLTNRRTTGKPDLQMNDAQDLIEIQLEGHPTRIRLPRFTFRRPEHDSERDYDPSEYSSSYEVHQFPLNLCFALTIHKSQGQSLTAARVYLGPHIRSYGQGYVALSRLTDLDGLSVDAYTRTAFLTDPVVEDFYKSIISARIRS